MNIARIEDFIIVIDNEKYSTNEIQFIVNEYIEDQKKMKIDDDDYDEDDFYVSSDEIVDYLYNNDYIITYEYKYYIDEIDVEC